MHNIPLVSGCDYCHLTALILFQIQEPVLFATPVPVIVPVALTLEWLLTSVMVAPRERGQLPV